MPEDRRHIAVMFTDIVGYTTLMGSDEDKAFDMLKRNHTIHATLIKKHNGKLIKEVGDGTLASFPLASDAVRCAMDIQKEAKSQKIPLKIGIHQGEMVLVGADVLGDAVNVASRLQESAEEGCISISGAVYRDVKNKAGIETEFIRDEVLKNVEDPIKVYKVNCKEEEPAPPPLSGQASTEQTVSKKKRLTYYIIAGLLVVIAAVMIWQFLPSKVSNPLSALNTSEKTIAVIPFWDDSQNSDNAYFCSGMEEAIRINLLKIADLQIESRQSVEKYRENAEKDIIAIGAELGVAYIVEGSVQKIEDDIQVTVQLIDAKTGKHIWAEVYDGDYEVKLLVFQSNTAKKIAASLTAVITPEEEQGIEQLPTTNIAAYDLYLKGLFYYNAHFQFETAITWYEEAIRLDPNFALAYAGIAQCYQYLIRYSYITISQEEGFKAKEAILKALELNSSLGEAYSALGFIMAIVDWNIYGAEEVFKRAIELSPGSAEVYSSYAQYLRWLGRYDESILLAKKAIEIAPLDPMTNLWLALYYTYDGQYNKCIQQMEKVSEIDASFYGINNVLSMNYTLMGMTDKALQNAMIVEESLPDFNEQPIFISTVGWVYARSGNIIAARKYLDLLHNLSDEHNVDPLFFAYIYIGMEDRDEALKWIGKGVEMHSGQTIYLNGYSDIFFQELISDPRYIALLKKIGFRID